MQSYSFSPQFDPDSKTFQHLNGYRDDKSVGDLLRMAWQFMTCETDPIEKTGFPVMSAADNAPRGVAAGAYRRRQIPSVGIWGTVDVLRRT